MATNRYDANYVRFLRGTPTAYQNLPKKDSDTLYFISEKNSLSGALYLGTKLISGSVSAYASIDTLTDVLTDNLKQGDILIYSEDEGKWINTTIPELANLVVRIMTGATDSTDGKSGLVPTPAAGDQEKFLRGDGQWVKITISHFKGATSSTGGEEGLVPAPKAGDEEKFLKGDGSWAKIVIPVMSGATSSSNGTSGLVPTPSAGSQDLFLNGSGQWTKVAGTLTEDMIQDYSNLKATVNNLIQGYEDRNIYQIAVQAIEDSLIAANAKEDLNSLGEIADWIQSTNNQNTDFNDRILALEHFVYEGTEDIEGNTSVIIQSLRTRVGNLNEIINNVSYMVNNQEESIIELDERTTWREFESEQNKEGI